MGGFVGALFTRWGTPWLNLYLTPAQTPVDHGRMRHNLFRLIAALSMAALAGVSRLRELSGAGLAKTLGVTRQAVSLTNRAVDEKIRGVTGGKSGAYGLRHTVDPRKGKARVHAAAPGPQEGGFPALPMRAHRGQGRPALPLHR